MTTEIKTTVHRAKYLNTQSGIMDPNMVMIRKAELNDLAAEWLAMHEFVEGVIEDGESGFWAHDKACELLGREPTDAEARALGREHDAYRKRRADEEGA